MPRRGPGPKFAQVIGPGGSFGEGIQALWPAIAGQIWAPGSGFQKPHGALVCVRRHSAFGDERYDLMAFASPSMSRWRESKKGDVVQQGGGEATEATEFHGPASITARRAIGALSDSQADLAPAGGLGQPPLAETVSGTTSARSGLPGGTGDWPQGKRAETTGTIQTA